MKKIAIASLIALAATTASALEVGVTATRDHAGTDRTFGGITVSETYGKFTATAGVERTYAGDNDQNRFSLVGGYNVAKFGPVTLTPTVGAVLLDNQVGQNGYAMTVGLGASMPVTKQVTLGVNVARQYGQSRVEQFDGNRVTVGLRYKF